jgi:hypothetical protein
VSSDPSKRYREALAALRAWSIRHAVDAPCIILCGFPKSGNTLTRFVYHNLIAATNEGATQTLSYIALNEANPNVAFPERLAERGFIAPRGLDHRGFPILLHSHGTWTPEWPEAGRTLLVVRDPLDALIGHWYTNVVFPVVPASHLDVDRFVLENLPEWIRRHRINAAHADAVLHYADLMRAPAPTFARAFLALDVRLDPKRLEQATEMSRIERIREMEDLLGQRHGHRSDPERNRRFGIAAWRDEGDVRFTRSGQHAQWRTALTAETIAHAWEMLAAEDLTGLLTPLEPDPKPAQSGELSGS